MKVQKKVKKMKLILQNNRLILLLLALLLSLVVISCSEDEADLGPENEFFVGTYMARDIFEVEMLAEIDSVNFSIDRGTKYSFDFFEYSNLTNSITFCDHSGTILGFGTGIAQFDPTSITYLECDTATIPRGIFTADFVTHGDTIWLYKEVKHIPEPPLSDTLYDSLFLLKLIQH